MPGLSGGDRGGTSLQLAVLTPVFAVVSFMVFQAAMWTHARTEVRAGARDAAVLIARFGAEPDDVSRSVRDALESTSALSSVEIEVPARAEIRASGIVEVTVTATAHGILLGTSTTVSATEAVPFEEFRE